LQEFHDLLAGGGVVALGMFIIPFWPVAGLLGFRALPPLYLLA